MRKLLSGVLAGTLALSLAVMSAIAQVPAPVTASSPVQTPAPAAYLTLSNEVVRLVKEGKYADAIPAAQQALASGEKLLGPDDQNLSTLLENLALVYRKSGRLDEEEPLLKRSLAIRDKTSSPNDPKLRATLESLIDYYLLRKRPEAIEPYSERSFALLEQEKGPDHLDVARALIDRGILANVLKKTADAEAYYKRALAIQEKTLGPEHPDLLEVLTQLKDFYLESRGFKNMEPLLARMALITENHKGPDHPDLAKVLIERGDLFMIVKKPADAEPLYRRALAIQEKRHGAESSEIATALGDLGDALRDLKRFSEADEFYRRRLTIQETKFGADSLEVATALLRIGDSLLLQTRYGESEGFYQRALAIRMARLGPEHRDIAEAMIGLGGAYRFQRQYDKALPYHKDSLAMYERQTDAEPTVIASVLIANAEVLLFLGRYNETVLLYKRVIDIYNAIPDFDQKEVAFYTDLLGYSYFGLGRYQDAEPLYKRAMAIYISLQGEDGPDVLKMMNQLAGLYQGQGRFEAAEALAKKVLNIRTAKGDEGIGNSLSTLAQILGDQGRYAEAEPLAKQSLALEGQSDRIAGGFGRDLWIAGARNNLAHIYLRQGRYAEAEPLFLSALSEIENSPEQKLPLRAAIEDNIGQVYSDTGRYAEAEKHVERALAIRSEIFGEQHAALAVTLGTLGTLKMRQNKYPEAQTLYRRALAVNQALLGQDHRSVAVNYTQLAGLYLRQGDHNRASENYAAATAIITRRVTLNSVDNDQREVKDYRDQYINLIKTTFQKVGDDRNERKRAGAVMFEAAQWAQLSEAATSLTQMAVRSAKGDVALSRVIRERQDLVAEFQTKDKELTALRALPRAGRNLESETTLAERLAVLTLRLDTIQNRLNREFPEFAALARLQSVSIADVQADLAPNEALVLFLDTAAITPLEEETFVWVVTKTDARWVRSALGTPALTKEIETLRCGLDVTAWRDALSKPKCEAATGATYGAGEQALGKAPPFDAARAHALYKALFGEVQDLIKDKHLLLVPSGPLTQLPFQVLVKSLPSDVQAGQLTWEIARLGIKQSEITQDDRTRLKWHGEGGTVIAETLPGTAAERAGLRPDDIVIHIGGTPVATSQQTVDAILARPPRSVVTIGLWRDGQAREITIELGAVTQTQWRPLFWTDATSKSIGWLAREHAMTVLPAVSSLKALRRVARPSAANLPMIGFGNPLLDGPADGRLAEQAKLTKDRQICQETPVERVARIVGLRRGGDEPIELRTGLADSDQIRRLAPLPETADELCAVARNLQADMRAIRLGAMANEREINALSANGTLARYRIVHFATHGALAGQIGGTREPGLILTPPARPSDEDDGYLSASEIAGLRLDAEWVILSACNTAGPAGSSGAEALSGLARAFFFAQARALLVSHWEVNSDATVRLITAAVGETTRDRRIGRAEALRRAMLSLMSDADRPWAGHPTYWAPFVLVGEGGANR